MNKGTKLHSCLLYGENMAIKAKTAQKFSKPSFIILSNNTTVQNFKDFFFL